MRKRVGYFVIVVSMTILAGCISIHPIKSSKLLEIQKRDIKFWPYEAKNAGIEIKIRPVTTQCDNFLFFDADFPSIGIVPVFVKLKNEGRLFISWTYTDFTLESPFWKWKILKFKKVKKRLFEKYDINAYSIKAYEQFNDSFDSLILHDGSLKKGEEANGVLFFDAGLFANAEIKGNIILSIKNVMIEGTKTTVVFPFKKNM